MENKEIIEKWIVDYLDYYIRANEVETRWRGPVVGIADAEDPLYKELKTIIDSTHALPSDIVPEARSVIAFFIPFSEEIANSNIPGEESSREWDYAYIETNNMISALSTHLYEKITEYGYKASNLPPTYNYDQKTLKSDWSHRSSAYIAGIGTFGINNMIITEKGCCGRFGSVITDWKLQPTERPQEEYCLYKREGICGSCVSSCVNDAFKIRDGAVTYDRYKCNEQIYDKIIPQWPIGPGDTCGKCMCGVPCSLENPSERLK
ncbi:MAG: epoxyqueuosine reductase [Clostridia bacterium]|nr:epoxyqueuosine reductase [Clostridia bacterium]